MPAVAMRAFLLLAGLLLAGCTSPLGGEGSSEATPSDVPDPLVPGPHSFTLLEYDFGYFVVDDPTLVPYQYPVPLHGSLHLPDGDGPAPVVALMHGRHSTCDYAGQVEFLAATCADAPPVVEPVNSYTGYDGLGGLLASWGYAVVSIDANTINDRDLLGDAGANARAALALRTLDEFTAVNATGQGLGRIEGGSLPMPLPANTPTLDVSAARGRLDLSRIGLMGHSRGGEGVARAIPLDAGAHGIDAVFALAPTDFARWPVPGVAFATLLPYCDGDVYNLQGALMYDDARRLDPAAPRHQVLAMGANHNFYNTVWTGDDWGPTGAWCGSDEKDTGRDTPGQQRAHGDGLMAAFFRLYVGGETAFAPMWDGADSVFPASLCPERPSCDGRLHASAMPVRHLDLAPDGAPGLPGGVASDPCTAASCPLDPTYGAAQQSAWDCSQPAAASFSVAGLRDWSALSLRVGAEEGARLWAEVRDDRGEPLAQWPAAALAARPGDPDAEPGQKTVLNEVRFAFAVDADVERATTLALLCSGGTLQVADVMLV